MVGNLETPVNEPHGQKLLKVLFPLTPKTKKPPSLRGLFLFQRHPIGKAWGWGT